MQVKIGEHTYQTGRLTSRQQLHIARRLAPVIGGLAKQAMGLTEAKMDAMSEAQMIGAVAGPVAEGLSKMKEEDVDYVLDKCLGVVSRIEGDGKLMPILDPATRANRYEDQMDMGILIKLTVAVVQENLASFLPGQPHA